MENPFDLLNERLNAIEKKLDSLMLNFEKKEDSSLPTWLTSKQLANHLGVSVSAITKLRGSKIPYYKIGGRILFKRQEIDEFIQKTRHKSGGEYLEDYLQSQEGKARLNQSRF